MSPPSDRRPAARLDRRTPGHSGYVISQQSARVDEVFGWIKTVVNFGTTRYRGRELTQLTAYLVGAGYNLIRIAKLIGAAA